MNFLIYSSAVQPNLLTYVGMLDSLHIAIPELQTLTRIKVEKRPHISSRQD